jgi:hypothetical protein
MKVMRLFVLGILLISCCTLCAQLSTEGYIQNQIDSIHDASLFFELNEKCVSNVMDVSDCNNLFWLVYKSLHVKDLGSPEFSPVEVDFIQSLNEEEIETISNNSLLVYLQMAGVVYVDKGSLRINNKSGVSALFLDEIEAISCDANIIISRYSLLLSYLNAKCGVGAYSIYSFGNNLSKTGKNYFGPNNFGLTDVDFDHVDLIYKEKYKSLSEVVIVNTWRAVSLINFRKLSTKMSFNSRLKFFISNDCAECPSGMKNNEVKAATVRNLTKRGYKLLEDSKEGGLEYLEFIYHN